MLATLVVVVLFGVLVWWITESYVKHLPSVVSRLPGGQTWPWATVLALLAIPVVLQLVGLPSLVTDDLSAGQSWAYASLWLAPLSLACIWLACYRSVRTAVLLAAAWVVVPSTALFLFWIAWMNKRVASLAAQVATGAARVAGGPTVLGATNASDVGRGGRFNDQVSAWLTDAGHRDG